MNCNYCVGQFDHHNHVPRLLIFCGHSLCESCCLQLHNNSRIQCPECMSNTFIEEVSFLPKNLALLKVTSPQAPGHGYCLKHEKKYQAFCKKQNALICVDCILHDNHRNHEMDSIKNAYLTHQSLFRDSVSQLEQLLAANQRKYQENLSGQRQSHQNYQASYESVQQDFQKLKQLIEREQQVMLTRLKQQYNMIEVKHQQKNAKLIDNIHNLSMALEALRETFKTSQVQFLANVTERQQIVAQINRNVEQNVKVFTFMQSRNTTADAVIKSIDKNFKTCVSSATHSSQGANKSLQNNNMKSKKTSSQHGLPSPTIKSYQCQQALTLQNPKPMSKKPTKKQPTAVSSTKSSANMPLTKCNINIEPEKRPAAKPKTQQKYDITKNCDVSMVQQKQSMFNSFFSNMTSFLNEQKFVYVIGGFDDESSSIIRLNISTYQWQAVNNLKTPRSKFGSVAVDKSLYILGGKKGRERVSDAEIWHNGTCTSTFAMRKRRSGFGIVALEHLIYVIGGNDGENILNTVEVYNTITGQWAKCESMLQARDELAVCVGKDKKIYVIGGFGGKNNEPLKSAQVYDSRTQKWQKIAPMNIQRRALAAAALADGIYAIGGFDGTKHLSSVQKYDQNTGAWVKVADLNQGRCTHSAISIFQSQQILVMGGFDEQALDSVQRYSLLTCQWEQVARLPAPRFMHSCVLLSE